MDKLLLPNEAPEKRLQYLEANADKVVNEKYYHRLSSDELIEKKALFTKNALEVDDLEDQKRNTLAEFKENLKPLKELHSRLGSEIRTGFEEKEGRLFKFIDEKSRMVYFYDENGELIETKTRPANSDELQNTIHMSLREGTNN